MYSLGLTIFFVYRVRDNLKRFHVFIVQCATIRLSTSADQIFFICGLNLLAIEIKRDLRLILPLFFPRRKKKDEEKERKENMNAALKIFLENKVTQRRPMHRSRKY